MLAAQDRQWICLFPEQHWVAQPKENSHTMQKDRASAGGILPLVQGTVLLWVVSL